jgi:hypothetical protein
MHRIVVMQVPVLEQAASGKTHSRPEPHSRAVEQWVTVPPSVPASGAMQATPGGLQRPVVGQQRRPEVQSVSARHRVVPPQGEPAGMHEREASQQVVPAAQRAVAQKVVPASGGGSVGQRSPLPRQRIRLSQQVVPGPHRTLAQKPPLPPSVPASTPASVVGHAPLARTRSPFWLASQRLEYVRPLQPQTGMKIVAQPSGRGTHTPGVPQPSPSQYALRGQSALLRQADGPPMQQARHRGS